MKTKIVEHIIFVTEITSICCVSVAAIAAKMQFQI